MTIHEIQTQGEGLSLSNVTVTKTFPFKPGDKSLFILVRDGSITNPTGLKIWGAAANCGVRENDVITVTGQGPRGGLRNQEYPQGSGKYTLNANDCNVIIQGAGQQATQESPQSRPAEQPAHHAQNRPSASLGHSQAEVARSAANMTRLYIDELVVNQGFSKEEAIQLAAGAHNLWAVSWFGDKSKPLG